MTKNILFVLTSHSQVENTDKITGFSLQELAKPYHLFQIHHYHCEIASIRGGKCTPEPSSMQFDDHEIKEFWETPQLRELVENSRELAEFNPDQFTGVYFVGGFGAMWDFPYDSSVNEFASKLYENGGVIGAVCHGPSALVNIKTSSNEPLIRGKNLTGFTNEEENQFDFVQYFPRNQTLEDLMRSVGAHYTKSDPMKEHVIRDDRIVTGQNPASCVGVAAQMIEIIHGMQTGGK
jgi:putative intracellular protease/amidase